MIRSLLDVKVCPASYPHLVIAAPRLKKLLAEDITKHHPGSTSRRLWPDDGRIAGTPRCDLV
jgi:hypothetical protein